MKIIVRKCLFLLIITSFLIAQENSDAILGYSIIKYINVVVEDNPIITNENIQVMVESIGYNTLPEYIQYSTVDLHNQDFSIPFGIVYLSVVIINTA